ncbi:hypothetical protein [Nostoc sp.]|uniref:hypothetical protein n=1 Tax=Nostoc sp. TaxID=1180 RepID=UPI002FFC4E01
MTRSNSLLWANGRQDPHLYRSGVDIAKYLKQVKGEISLTQLQGGLKMPMVEVWLGLLLGGFTLEQRGDFYHNQNVWVKSSPSYYQ